MLTLDNVVTTDKFEDCQLGTIPDAVGALVDIWNNSVRMQIAVGEGNQIAWVPAEIGRLQAPIRGMPITGCRGIRFKSAVSGSPARIVADLYVPGDAAMLGGTPNAQTLSSSGQAGNAVNVGTIALASFPPTGPSDGDTYWLVLPTTYDPVGGKQIRWLVTYDAALSLWHVSGAPLYSRVDTSEAAAGVAYANLATVGPAITLPRPADLVEFGYGATVAYSPAVTTGPGRMSVDFGGGAVDADDVEHTASGAAFTDSIARYVEKTSLAVGTYTAKYRSNNAGDTATFKSRWLRATVLRIT